jgi:hypothetical protein
MPLGAASRITGGRGVVNRYGFPFVANASTVIGQGNGIRGSNCVEFDGSTGSRLETTVAPGAFGSGDDWTIQGFCSLNVASFSGFMTLVRGVQLVNNEPTTAITISVRGFGSTGSAAIEYDAFDVTGGNRMNFNGNFTFTQNEYFHWAVTFRDLTLDGATFDIYVAEDGLTGTRVSSETSPAAVYRPFGNAPEFVWEPPLALNLKIGGPTNPMNGLIDSVKFSNIAEYSGTSYSVPDAGTTPNTPLEFTNTSATKLLLNFNGPRSAAGLYAPPTSPHDFRDTF